MPLLEKATLRISFQSVEARGELVRILAPRTAERLLEAMPFTSKSFLWKEEIYFETPVSLCPEKPKPTVHTGDMAYWPPGKAFCIFFGRSQPYSPVNVIGRITSDLEALRKVRQGERVKVSLAD
ncbi:MAG: hypothetical protein FJZ49_07595 [Candidatus Verstraetearchaeota archaeon]|nr:hypothetical protein [Candidatus Verstraetearchaeota archaeon]